MSAVLQLSAPGSDARARAPKAPPRPAAPRRKKVWSGARKRLAGNPLQMSLPGLGQVL
ncbi:MAG TPA: hypothetical protein VNZ54_00020 [bacterium]|jgi:hypothetical protein|nr:hypothetical protein [bacterium]HXB96401.1 hypothetical protein [bacterium]